MAGLGPEYVILHAVPLGAGSSDIDHVVIGPTGVFTVNTKNHSGQKVWVAGNAFMVNGVRQPYIRNSVFEARRTAKILTRTMGRPVAVTAMVVVVDPATFTVKTKPDGVDVITCRRLLRCITQGPRVYSAADVAALVARAQNPSVWHTAPPDHGNPGELMTRFKMLRQTVRRARARKRMWGLAGMASIVAIVAVAALNASNVVELVIGG